METERNLTENEQMMKNAWQQHFSEEFMCELNIIDESILSKIKYTLHVIFDFKDVWIRYNPHDQFLEVLLTFKWHKSWFRRKNIVYTICNSLHAKFPNLDLEVREEVPNDSKQESKDDSGSDNRKP